MKSTSHASLLVIIFFKEAEVYLLDDPLSAVDAKVGQHIFHQCIKEFLREKSGEKNFEWLVSLWPVRCVRRIVMEGRYCER